MIPSALFAVLGSYGHLLAQFEPSNRNDVFDRAQRLAESTDPIVILFGLLGLLFLLMLALFGYRLTLFTIMIVSATFSGAMWAALDSGSTIIRWIVLVLLAFNVLRFRTNPGLPLLLYGAYAIVGIGMIPFSEAFTWSVQMGGLVVATFLVAVVLGDCVPDKDAMRRIFYILLAGAMSWLALGVMTFPQLLQSRGQRLSGAITSAPLFVLTGGLLLPILIWAVFRPGKKRWKLPFIGMALACLALLFLSGQRTGTFAGLIGIMPIILTRGRRAVVFLTLCGVAAFVGLAALSVVNPKQMEFVIERFSNTSTTGRAEIWAAAFEECLSQPFIGRGHGGERAHVSAGHRIMHNVYLTVWYNTGLIGLALFVAAYIVALWQSWQTFRRSKDAEIKLMAIVLFGLVLAQMAGGMFETMLGASSFPSILRVLTFVLVARLAVISVAPTPALSNPQWYFEPRTRQWYLYLPGYYVPGRTNMR